MLVSDPTPPDLIKGLILPPLFEKWTAAGKCKFREARIPIPSDAAFQASWRGNRRKWIERGFSLRNVSGAWILQQWLLVTDKGLSLTETGRQMLANTYQRALPLVTEAPSLVLPELRDDLTSKLRGYQIDPARQLYRALSNGRSEWGYSGAVDLSDMGTGKTYMAIAAALQTGRKPCVLCPSVGQQGWLKAFAHFGAEAEFIDTYEAVRGNWRKEIVSMDSTGKFTWKNPTEIILILDEAQALRHDDTLTSRCCAGAIRQGIPILIASATIATSPIEMRFAGRITGLHNGGDDWARFMAEHGCIKTGGSWKWDGKNHHLTRINQRLFPFRGCRVRMEDLGDECPETKIEVLSLDVPQAARLQKEWKGVADLLDRLKKQGMAEFVITAHRRRARMAAWKACEDALVEPVAELIKADLAAGRSVAVFMNFNDTRMRLGRLLNTHDGFYGGQPLKIRQQLERDFQANRIHVLISNIGAGGASVSLHDTTGERPRSSYIFPTDDPVKMRQSTGRIARTGGKSMALQWIVAVKGALTEEIVNRSRRKMLALDSINNGHKVKTTGGF